MADDFEPVDDYNLSEAEIGKKVAKRFREKFEGTVEGPIDAGSFRFWRVWTYKSDDDSYQAHYAIAKRGEATQVYQNFLPFAAWIDESLGLSRRLAQEGEARRVRETDERLRAWVRIFVSSAILLVFLGLVCFKVLVDPKSGFNVAYVVTALLGGGVAYLLGDWVRRRPHEAKD